MANKISAATQPRRALNHIICVSALLVGLASVFVVNIIEDYISVLWSYDLFWTPIAFLFAVPLLCIILILRAALDRRNRVKRLFCALGFTTAIGLAAFFSRSAYIWSNEVFYWLNMARFQKEIANTREPDQLHVLFHRREGHLNTFMIWSSVGLLPLGRVTGIKTRISETLDGYLGCDFEITQRLSDQVYVLVVDCRSY